MRNTVKKIGSIGRRERKVGKPVGTKATWLGDKGCWVGRITGIWLKNLGMRNIVILCFV